MTSQPAARSAPAPQRERATSTSSQHSSKSGAAKSAKAAAKSATRAEARKASSSSCGTDQASGDEKANDLPKMSYAAAILRQQEKAKEAARQNKNKQPVSASSLNTQEPAIMPAPPSDCDVSARDSRSSSMSSLPPTSAAARTTADNVPVTSQSGAAVGGQSQQSSRHSQPPSNKAAPVHSRSPLHSATAAPDAEPGAKDAPAPLNSEDGVAVSNGATHRENQANAYVSRENGPRTFSSRGHYGRGRGGNDFHRHPRDRDYARDYTRRHDDTGAGQYGRHPREHNGPSSRGHHSNYRGGGGGHYRGGGYRRHQQAPPRENRQVYVLE